MPLARVVTFDGVSGDRIAEIRKEMEASEQPDDVRPRKWSFSTIRTTTNGGDPLLRK